MTIEMNVPLDEIRGLLDERTRYEGWLAALEQRRAATPPHVFDRVWRDYQTRLDRVQEALGGHLGGLRGAESEHAQRHEELTRTLAERRDQLAEAELRTLVGEFAPQDGERVRRDFGEQITALEGELASVTGALGGLRGLLERAGASAGAGDGQAGRTESGEPAFPAGEPDRGASAITPADAQPAIAPEPVAAHAAADPPAGQQPADVPLAGHDDATEHLAPPLGVGAREEAPAAPPAGELAYAGQGFASQALSATGAAPMPVAPGAEQQKTLKCQDCGEMNYPTEWYCERCGGELAAL